MQRRVAKSLLTAIVGAVAIYGALAQPAVGDEVPYSYTNPPAICQGGEAPEDPCIHQPTYDSRDSTSTPIFVDFPLTRVNITERVTGGVSGLSDISAYFTFTITDGGTPVEKAGYAFSPADWGDTISLTPLTGLSDPAADPLLAHTVARAVNGTTNSCDGHITCSYVAFEDAAPGWYSAASGSNGRLVGKSHCRLDRPAVCDSGWTASTSAVYIPEVDEIEPPFVDLATTGAGTTSKAIADYDFEGDEPVTLHIDWGDGSGLQLAQPGQVQTHEYATPGDYFVTAIASTPSGRRGTDSAGAKVDPPRPILQAVARDGSSTTGAAAGTFQGWPDAPLGTIRYWEDGCPDNPDADYGTGLASPSRNPTAEGTVSMSFVYLPPGANAFLLEGEARVPVGAGDSVLTHGLSECVEMSPDAVFNTTGALSSGATEIPVDSASVPVGNMAVIDAGAASGFQDLAEQREVAGHGSLLVDPLARSHGSGARVIDAGAPLAPYVPPGPPADPTLGPGPSAACVAARSAVNEAVAAQLEAERQDEAAADELQAAEQEQKRAQAKSRKAKQKYKRAKKSYKSAKGKSKGKQRRAKKKLKKAAKQNKKAKKQLKSAKSGAERAAGAASAARQDLQAANKALERATADVAANCD